MSQMIPDDLTLEGLVAACSVVCGPVVFQSFLYSFVGVGFYSSAKSAPTEIPCIGVAAEKTSLCKFSRGCICHYRAWHAGSQNYKGRVRLHSNLEISN